nr:GABA transporter 1-like [Ipomoea batatas]
MATVAPRSAGPSPIDAENGVVVGQKELDAGALFVLKSQGSWLHCGYHMTTAIVAPALLSLPFAFTFLGWVGGLISLTLAGTVTFYSYYLLSVVLEHHDRIGKRQLRFRDMAHHILGHSNKAPTRDYSVTGSGINRVFGIFNAVSIIATTYGNGIIPEIQATIAPPVTGKMLKGLLVCYSVVISTFFSVSISGYWAFGNQAQGSVLQNFMVDGKPLLPKWFLLMTNVFTLTQVSAVTLPSNVVLENKCADPKKDVLSIRNVVPRLIARSATVVIATTLAAMLPFFGDIMAIFGAFGCIPLDFILPMVFYNVTFKPSKKSIIFWGNTIIAVVSTVFSLIGAVSSVRQMVLDAKTYRLFANM